MDSLTVDSPDREQEVDAVLKLGCLPGVGTRTLWRILETYGSGAEALRVSVADLNSCVGSDVGTALFSSELDLRVRRALDRCRVMEIEVLLWRDAPLHRLWSPHSGDACGPPRGTWHHRREWAGPGHRRRRAPGGFGRERGHDRGPGFRSGPDTARLSPETRGAHCPGGSPHVRVPAGRACAGSSLSASQPDTRRAVRCDGGRGGRHKSGALITVEHALDVGRDVYVVPGPLDAPQSRGCNALIQQGAHLITSPDDFVRDLGLVCGSSKEFRDDRRDDRRPAGLDAEAGRVWHVLDERPAAIDDLACRAALDTSGALAALTSLELEGWVIQEPGMRFRRAS